MASADGATFETKIGELLNVALTMFGKCVGVPRLAKLPCELQGQTHTHAERLTQGNWEYSLPLV